MNLYLVQDGNWGSVYVQAESFEAAIKGWKETYSSEEEPAQVKRIEETVIWADEVTP